MNIFDGIDKNDLKLLTDCLQAVKKTYQKNEIIFDIDDEINSVAYVIEGCVELSIDDWEGNKVIMSQMSKGEIFAEAMVCAGLKNSLVCAKSLTDTQILFLNFKRILTTCSSNCKFHQKLIENIIKIISCKNLILKERIKLLSKKTLRERILYMLYQEKVKSKKDIFEIPYSREEMAEYIGADRSALSRELSKMKNEKILDYHKNTFKLFS